MMLTSERSLSPFPPPPAERSFEFRASAEAIRLLVETASMLLRDRGYRETLHLVSPRNQEVWEFVAPDRHVSISVSGPSRGADLRQEGVTVLHLDGSGFEEDFEPLVQGIVASCVERFARALLASLGADGNAAAARLALARLFQSN